MRTVCDLKDPAHAPAWSGGSQEPLVSPVVSLAFVIPSVGVISLSFLGAGVVLYMWDACGMPVCFFTCLFSEFIFSAAGEIFKHFLIFFKVVAVF